MSGLKGEGFFLDFTLPVNPPVNIHPDLLEEIAPDLAQEYTFTVNCEPFILPEISNEQYLTITGPITKRQIKRRKKRLRTLKPRANKTRRKGKALRPVGEKIYKGRVEMSNINVDGTVNFKLLE